MNGTWGAAHENIITVHMAVETLWKLGRLWQLIQLQNLLCHLNKLEKHLPSLPCVMKSAKRGEWFV